MFYKKTISVIFLFLINISCQAIVINANKWDNWEQHPIYTFYQVIPDSSDIEHSGIILKTRGGYKGIFGTSFPLFNIKEHCNEFRFNIKYKAFRCRDLFLTFHFIGYNMNEIDTDTIKLPISGEWMELSSSINFRKCFSIEVSIEVQSWKEEIIGELLLSDFVVYLDDTILNNTIANYAPSKIPVFYMKQLDDLLSSSIMNKKILSLGETIHGTQTLCDIAFNLIKERVTKHRCKLILLELPISMCLYMDRYVKNDSHYFIENIQEMIQPFCSFDLLSILEWIKEYNKENYNEISLVGVDGEYAPVFCKMALYKFIDSANSDSLTSINRLCHDMLVKTREINIDTSLTNKILTPRESLLLHYSIKNMQEYKTTSILFKHRDKIMAENISNICTKFLASAETATFYGHLTHSNYVVTSTFSFIHNSPSMGKILKKKYGKDYSCIALSVCRGDCWYSTLENARICKQMQDAPSESLEYIVGNKENISFFFTNNLSYDDVYKVRFASALYRPSQFSYLTVKNYFDGIVVVDSAKPINSKDNMKEKELLLTEQYFNTIYKLRDIKK